MQVVRVWLANGYGFLFSPFGFLFFSLFSLFFWKGFPKEARKEGSVQ